MIVISEIDHREIVETVELREKHVNYILIFSGFLLILRFSIMYAYFIVLDRLYIQCAILGQNGIQHRTSLKGSCKRESGTSGESCIFYKLHAHSCCSRPSGAAGPLMLMLPTPMLKTAGSLPRREGRQCGRCGRRNAGVRWSHRHTIRRQLQAQKLNVILRTK